MNNVLRTTSLALALAAGAAILADEPPASRAEGTAAPHFGELRPLLQPLWMTPNNTKAKGAQDSGGPAGRGWNTAPGPGRATPVSAEAAHDGSGVVTVPGGVPVSGDVAGVPQPYYWEHPAGAGVAVMPPEYLEYRPTIINHGASPLGGWCADACYDSGRCKQHCLHARMAAMSRMTDLGGTNSAIFGAQVLSGNSSQMMLFDYDFRRSGPQLSIRGERELRRMASILPSTDYVIRLEATPYNVPLAESRRAEVVRQLGGLLPGTDVASRVAVSEPLTRGLDGIDAIPIQATLMQLQLGGGLGLGQGDSFSGNTSQGGTGVATPGR